MLLTNGRIYTLDAGGSVVDSLVLRDGRIAFAGRAQDVNPAAGERTLDLGGRAVLPGLTDAHAHLMALARARFTLSAAHLDSEAAVARVVAAAAATTPRGEWLHGRGWDQTLWREPHFPTRASLDEAAPHHPVALVRVDGHAIWASSAALARAGITRDTAAPPGGIIVRNEDGEPTGLLIDTAQELVRRVQPRVSEERFDAAVQDAIGECLSKGLTGIHEMGADLDAIASYSRLIERGQFPFRNYAAVSGKKAWALHRERGIATIGDGQLVIRALKVWLDGALGSRGAALHAPYCDDPGNLGLLLMSPEELEETARDAAASGFQLCVHAIGDRANTLALDVLEAVHGRAPDRHGGGAPVRRHRSRVEHAQVLTASDIPRFRRLDVIPSMQPTHCTSDMRWAPERLGPDRTVGAYAWRSLLDTGVSIAGGSDFPVEDPNPFHGIYAAVTRRPLDGRGPGWQREQRMTREEAVRAFTMWNAYASFQEHELGSLERGKRADLVVLSEDVFTCAEERIKAIAPVLTMIGGEIVHGGET